MPQVEIRPKRKCSASAKNGLLGGRPRQPLKCTCGTKDGKHTRECLTYKALAMRKLREKRKKQREKENAANS